jgi:hypothetical protein
MGAPVPAADMICQQNDMPPPSYHVDDYVPAEPEYLPVDYLEWPAPGTSQTPATQPAPNRTARKSLHFLFRGQTKSAQL